MDVGVRGTFADLSICQQCQLSVIADKTSAEFELDPQCCGRPQSLAVIRNVVRKVALSSAGYDRTYIVTLLGSAEIVYVFIVATHQIDHFKFSIYAVIILLRLEMMPLTKVFWGKNRESSER